MPLDARIPVGAFDGDGQSSGVTDFGRIVAQKTIIEDRDRERANQDEIKRIAQASGGNYEMMIKAMRQRGLHKEADAYETDRSQTLLRNSQVIDAGLKREAEAVEKGTQYAYAVLNAKTPEEAARTWEVSKNLTAKMGNPKLAEELYGATFDPLTYKERMQAAVTMGTTIAQNNTLKRQAIEDFQQGRNELAISKVLSTIRGPMKPDAAANEEEWTRVRETFRSQGMPEEVLKRIPEHWSEENAKQVAEMTLDENTRTDNATARMNAEAAAARARGAAGAAGGPLSAVDVRAKRAAELSAFNARQAGYRKLTEDLGDPKLVVDKQARINEIEEQFTAAKEFIKQQYGAVEGEPPPKPTSIGDMAIGPNQTHVNTGGLYPSQGRLDSWTNAPSPPPSPTLFGPGSQSSIGTATAPPMTSIPEMAGVAADAGGNPNSPAPVAPPPPAGPLPPAAAPSAPTQAQPGARPAPRPFTPPTTYGGGLPTPSYMRPPQPAAPPPPPQPKPTPKAEPPRPQLNLSVPEQRTAARQLAREIIRSLTDKNGKPYEGTETQIDAFLKDETNRKLLNVVEKR